MAEKVILTEEGYHELEKKLDELKFVKRPEITERIKIARDFGDLSENAEYDAAKNEQARIEGEIAEIEATLKFAEIVKGGAANDIVSVGKKIEILDIDFNETCVYEIVGTTEADINKNKISNDSPLGNALIGKKVGEIVTVKAPAGDYQVKLISIQD